MIDSDTIRQTLDDLPGRWAVEGGAVLDVYRDARLVCRVSRWRGRLRMADRVRCDGEVMARLNEIGVTLGEYGG